MRSPIDAIDSIDDVLIGEVIEGDAAIVIAAMAAAQAGFAAWNATPVAERAAALERAADLIEPDRGALIALLQSEGGKTIEDAVAEVREAADYARYYAAQARRLLQDEAMPGPPGRATRCAIAGAAPCCISPWNFRSRSSAVRSWRRLPPATRWSPSPPSRRRASPPRGAAFA